jgi:hypothetical protein
MNLYDYGSPVTVSVAFTDPTQTPAAPIDPTTVKLRILDPNNNEQVISGASFIHPAVGNFSFTVICLVAGVWFYRWEGSGNINAVADSLFVITATQFKDAAA